MIHTAKEWADRTGCSVKCKGAGEIYCDECMIEPITASKDWFFGEIIKPASYTKQKYSVMDWAKWLGLAIIVENDGSCIIPICGHDIDLTEFIKEV